MSAVAHVLPSSARSPAQARAGSGVPSNCPSSKRRFAHLGRLRRGKLKLSRAGTANRGVVWLQSLLMGEPTNASLAVSPCARRSSIHPRADVSSSPWESSARRAPAPVLCTPTSPRTVARAPLAEARIHKHGGPAFGFAWLCTYVGIEAPQRRSSRRCAHQALDGNVAQGSRPRRSLVQRADGEQQQAQQCSKAQWPLPLGRIRLSAVVSRFRRFALTTEHSCSPSAVGAQRLAGRA